MIETVVGSTVVWLLDASQEMMRMVMAMDGNNAAVLKVSRDLEQSKIHSLS